MSSQSQSDVLFEALTPTDDTKALQDGVIALPPGRHGVWAATGADRLAFLHRLLTASIKGLQDGQGSQALLLTVKAQIVSELKVFAGPDWARLVVDEGTSQDCATTLQRYAVMDDFVLAPWDHHGAWHLAGPQAAALLHKVGASVPENAKPYTHREGAAGWTLAIPALGGSTYRFFAASSEANQALAATLSEQGVQRLGAEASEVARIEAGEPAPGKEITADRFPVELALGPAIDYGKGCFLGQEPIVRVRDRGKLNWRLCTLAFQAGAGPVHAGSVLSTADRPKAGHVTSAVQLGGRAHALAFVHAAVPDGSVVEVHGDTGACTATVVERSVPALG